MLPKEITITKENQMNLNEVKGFVLYCSYEMVQHKRSCNMYYSIYTFK